MASFAITQVDVNGEPKINVIPTTSVAEIVIEHSSKSISFTLNNGGVVEVPISDEAVIAFVTELGNSQWSLKTTEPDIHRALAKQL